MNLKWMGSIKFVVVFKKNNLIILLDFLKQTHHELVSVGLM